MKRAIGILSSLFALACGADVDLNDSGVTASGAFISGAVDPDRDCRPSIDLLRSSGTYDIGSFRSKPTACSKPYALNLIVNTMVDEIVLFDQAEVSLKTVADELLVFMDSSPEAVRLPNPYQVTSAGRVTPDKHEGVVRVQAIALRYASKLGDFVGDGLVIEVKLRGQTPEGHKVATQVFRFPIAICRQCLMVCAASLPDDVDLHGDGCADNTPADDRICVDPDPACAAF